MIYVEDVDAIAVQAVEAGAKTLRPVKDQFYGDRSGTVEDPYGHVWTISTHVEDVSSEEMCRARRRTFDEARSWCQPEPTRARTSTRPGPPVCEAFRLKDVAALRPTTG